MNEYTPAMDEICTFITSTRVSHKVRIIAHIDGFIVGWSISHKIPLFGHPKDFRRFRSQQDIDETFGS